MLGIVLNHIISHCVYVQLTDVESIASMGNGWFSYPKFYKELIVPLFFRNGQVGNAIFILITGYFLIKKGSHVNLRKSTIKLIGQLAFASITLMILPAILFHFDNTSFTYLPGTGMFNSYSWYLGFYLVIILCANYFYNDFLAQISKRAYETFLLILLAAISFYWTGVMADSLMPELRNFGAGLFFYALGAYIRLYNPFKKINAGFFLIAIVGVYALFIFGARNATITAIEEYVQSSSTDAFVQPTFGYSIYSVETIIIAVSLFELFRRLPIPNSKIINYVAASTLMVYLLHDNQFFYSLWNRTDWITILAKEPLYHFLGTLFAWGLVIFAIGVVAYAIYCAIERHVSRLVQKYIV